MLPTNTGTLGNDYTFVNGTNVGVVTGLVTPPSGVTVLNSATAGVFASYAGFSPSIWAASTSGFPILENIPVYVSSSGVTFGSATSSITTLGLTVLGLQGAGGGNVTVANIDSVASSATNPFTVTTDNGFVDAGKVSAASILSSPAYANIKGIVTVAPKTLTVTGATKTYDGTTAVTDATLSITGFVGSQTLAVTGTSGSYASKDVGSGLTVNNLTYAVTDAANGGKASNYALPTTINTGSITPKTIDLASATISDKSYDGTAAATASGLALSASGIVAGDSVSVGTFTASFADPNAGQGKAVTVTTNTLTGAQAADYQVASFTTTGNINPLAVTLFGVKPADGAATASGSSLVATNAIGNDVITFGGQAFARLGLARQRSRSQASPGFRSATPIIRWQALPASFRSARKISSSTMSSAALSVSPRRQRYHRHAKHQPGDHRLVPFLGWLRPRR